MEPDQERDSWRAFLEQVKAHMVQNLGYRIERDTDGTERLIRPDGTVAVVAIDPLLAHATKDGRDV